MAEINVGDTFSIDGQKWSIKLIDLVGNDSRNKTGEPRIDASRFYTDEFGEEKVRKGRPSKFTVDAVCKAMGIPIPDATKSAIGFSKPIETTDKVEEEWSQLRESNRETVENLINLIPDADNSTNEDW